MGYIVHCIIMMLIIGILLRVIKKIEDMQTKAKKEQDNNAIISASADLLFRVLHMGFQLKYTNFDEDCEETNWIGKITVNEWGERIKHGIIVNGRRFIRKRFIAPVGREECFYERDSLTNKNFDIVFKIMDDTINNIQDKEIQSKLDENFINCLEVINRLIDETPTLVGESEFIEVAEQVLHKYYNIHKKIVGDYEKLQKAKKEKEEELRRLEEERKEKQRQLQIELEKTKLNAFVNKWDKEFRIDLEE